MKPTLIAIGTVAFLLAGCSGAGTSNSDPSQLNLELARGVSAGMGGSNAAGGGAAGGSATGGATAGGAGGGGGVDAGGGDAGPNCTSWTMSSADGGALQVESLAFPSGTWGSCCCYPGAVLTVGHLFCSCIGAGICTWHRNPPPESHVARGTQYCSSDLFGVMGY